MKTTVLSACALVALATTGAAQTSTAFAGKITCAKPDQNYAVPIADGPHHALALASIKCTWTEGTLGGERLKDEQETISSDATGDASNDRGYGVGTVANGDKYFVHFKGESKLTGGQPTSGECTWKFTGGTGKLKDIKGKGTCKGTFRPDGTASWDIKGDYVLGAPAKS
jgi:hypothetical protein